MAKKLSTAEILARARGEVGGGKSNGDGAEQASEAPAAEQSPVEETTAEKPAAAEAAAAQPPEPAEPAKPAAPPQSTKDKLAAARAQAAAKKAGGAAPAAKPPANGEKPAAAKKPTAAMSTQEKLAALRAEAKSGGKQPTGTEAVPKAAKTATKPMPAGERPSVQEMIKVAREGGAKPAVPAKREARKPAAAAAARKAAAAKGEPDPQRRNVILVIFAVAWGALALALTAATLGFARFMMPNVLVEPPSKFKIGPPTDFPPDTVDTRFKAEFGVWIVNTLFNGNRMIYALSTVCTHLGCTPNWLDGEQKFKCPCHGSGFYITGINFEGPAPRPLERVGIRLGPDGLLEVDKSVKFQQEMGQWDDDASFVNVV